MPVPDGHPLFDRETTDGTVTLRSQEITSPNICYLAHTLTVPQTGSTNGLRTFVCTIINEHDLADPQMTTPRNDDETRKYLIKVKDMIGAFTNIAAAANSENRDVTAFLPAGTAPNNEPMYLGLAYQRPRGRRETGVVSLLRTHGQGGVVIVEQETLTYRESGRRHVQGELSLADAEAAKRLLEKLPAIEADFQELQAQRRQAFHGAMASAIENSVSPDLEVRQF